MVYNLFDFERPINSHYVVLDVIAIQNIKIIFLIKIPDDYELEIGQEKCEITIPDNSVGKRHGTLKYDLKMGELVYKDKLSTMRSLVLIQRPVKLHHR